MLGSDRFAFETPNVIDPGDLPPSAPRREHRSSTGSKSNNSRTVSTTSMSTHGSTEEDYQEARESRARLLNDIDDLDLSPPEAQQEPPYDPYGDDDDDVNDPEYARGHHSLPAVEEARTYAAALLADSPRRPKEKLSLGRTAPVRTSTSRHLGRKHIVRISGRVGIIIALVVVVLVVVLTMVNRNHSRSDGSEGSKQLQPPKQNPKNLPSTQEDDAVFDYIVQFFSDNKVSSKADLTTPGKPQYEAARWLAREDRAMPPLPKDLLADYGFVQRYVLAVFYFATNGAGWDEQYNFLTPQHECAWYVATQLDEFIGHEYAAGVSCDQSKMRVRDVFLPHSGLKGSLPSELSFLQHLQMLALPENEIAGTIPSALKALSQLHFLDLKNNLITGSIPEWIGDLSGLEVLGLSNNNMDGSVPNSFGTLGRLHTLALDNNAFTGSLEFANHLTKLDYLYADRNLFSFEVKTDFLQNLIHLDELDLSSNDIYGKEWPINLLDLPTLRVLDLANNRLSATLPTSIAEDYFLEYFSLRNNRMHGRVPSSIKQLRSLTHLDLQNNTFTGHLPLELKELTDLTFFAAGYNNFLPSNSMPPFLDEMTALQELSLPSTQLSGIIPDWIGVYLPQLEYIDFSNNRLKETIPASLMEMENLRYLLLHGNVLTGQIPPTSGTKFEIFTAHQNSPLTGDLTSLCTNSVNLDIVATDCQTGITCPCCAKCCKPGDITCFVAELSEKLRPMDGLWQLDFSRAPFAFDPDILDETGLFGAIVPKQP